MNATPVENWYALHTKPYKESFVTDQLTDKGIEHYYPTIPHAKHTNRMLPFFPGYLFIRADLDALGISTFAYMRGCRGLVQFGDWPTAVPESVIASVQQSAAAYALHQGRGMERGTAVAIVDGPLAGYEAVFERYASGKERVVVLLSLLGRRVTVGAEVVTAVN